MRILFTMLFIITSLLSTFGQQTNLVSYIKQLESQHKVVFSYNESLLKNIQIHKAPNGNNLDELLSELVDITAFDFKKVDAENILVTAKQKNKNLRLCLKIIDASTKEDLIGSTVYNLKDKTGFAFSTSNSIQYVNLSEWDTVAISFVGYTTVYYPINYFNGKDCETIALKTDLELIEFTVEAYLNNGIKYNHGDQSISISTSEAGLLPGETETDILIAIEALPGIKSPDGKAGNLVVRGDDPDKTLVTFDDIPIYHNGHYFGAFSPFNASITEDVKIYRSGFGVENGGRVGGAIQLRSKQGIPDSAAYGIGASTSYLSGYAFVPIRPKKTSILLGGRSSYPFKWNSPKINAISDFVFQNSIITAAEDLNFVEMTAFDVQFSDVNAKITHKINDNNTLGISFLNFYNDFHIEIIDTMANTSNTNNATLKNWGANLNHAVIWNDKITTNNSITISDFDQLFTSNLKNDTTTREKTKYENTVSDISLKTTTTINFSHQDLLQLGYNLTHHNVYSFREINRSVEPLLDIDSNKAMLHSLFGSYSFARNNKFQATLGIRGTYYSLLKKIYAAPRLLVNFHVDNNFTLKTNWGMYNQFVNHLYGTHAFGPGIENYNWRLSNGTNTPVVNAKQAMFGFIFNKKGWVLDVEGYKKITKDISIHNQYNYQNTEDHFQGDYSTSGIDFTLKKSWTNFDAWVGYTISNTLVHYDSIQEDAFESIWNQNDVFNSVLSYSNKGFAVSVGWKYKSGLATLNGIRFLYTNGPNTNPVKPQPPVPPGAPQPPILEPEFTTNSDPDYGTQFPSYHQLDVSISYRFIANSKKWNCNIGASIMNLYDTKIIIGQSVRKINGVQPNLYERSNLYGIGRAPSLMLTLNF